MNLEHIFFEDCHKNQNDHHNDSDDNAHDDGGRVLKTKDFTSSTSANFWFKKNKYYKFHIPLLNYVIYSFSLISLKGKSSVQALLSHASSSSSACPQHVQSPRSSATTAATQTFKISWPAMLLIVCRKVEESTVTVSFGHDTIQLVMVQEVLGLVHVTRRVWVWKFGEQEGYGASVGGEKKETRLFALHTKLFSTLLHEQQFCYNCMFFTF